jgi:hypothetical protein
MEAISHAPELNSGLFIRSMPGEFANGYESQIHNGIILGDHVFVFILGAAMNELRLFRDLHRADGQFCQALAIGLRQMFASPFRGLPGCNVKVGGFVQTRNHAIVIASDGGGSEFIQQIHYFRGVRAVTNEVATAKSAVIANVFGFTNDRGEGLNVRMDVAEYEITHSV